MTADRPLEPRGDSRSGPCLTRPTGSLAARLDGCPNCVENTEVPYGQFTTSHGVVAMYRCTDCGVRWHTSWKEAVA